MTTPISPHHRTKPGPKVGRRLPLAPLEEALAGGDADIRKRANIPITNDGTVLVAYIAHVCGVNRITVYRWRDTGLSTYQADRAAVAVGLHPLNVWPDWGREDY